MFNAPHQCGICRQGKSRITYTFQKAFGVKSQEVYLCKRCDLTAEPLKEATG